MKAGVIPLAVGALVFLSSLISLKLGLSVAVIEILVGAAAGNLGLKPEEWMTYMASFGGIILTFLAGAEIDTRLMREKFRESFFIGTLSFLLPFAAVFLYTDFAAGWSYRASLIAGTALSTTSLAVVDSVLVGVVIASAVIPTFVAQKWFRPVHSEDVVETDLVNGHGEAVFTGSQPGL